MLVNQYFVCGLNNRIIDFRNCSLKKYIGGMCMKNFLILLLLAISLLNFGCSKKGDDAVTSDDAKDKAATETVVYDVVLATGEWAPYTSDKMEGYGFFTEIVTAALDESGLKYKYEFYPWKRCENNLSEGKIFAIFPYMKTAEREKEFNFSENVFASTGKFFYLKSKITKDVVWTKLEDLTPYKIGGVLGYWYEKPFNDAGLKVDWVADDESNIKKLYGERCDLIASDELVGWQGIMKLFPGEKDKFATVKKPLNVDELKLMVSRKYPGSDEKLVKFNQGLEKIRSNGKYADILLKKYNLSAQ